MKHFVVLALALPFATSCTGAARGEPTSDARHAKQVPVVGPDADAPLVVRLQEVVVPPMPPSYDVVVAEFTTEYRRWGRYHGRARNVERAAELLDGVVIEPGETLSFNERVGPRTMRAGFRRAPVILAGELTDGVGGGVCQVASTLHAAAWEGGLEIVEHKTHSRPSSYLRMGLDATVAYPVIDLKVKNPFWFPVRVDARAADGEVVVRVVGAERPREVESELRVLSRSGYSERIVEDPSLPAGVTEVTQDGIRGATVERVRTIREGEEVATHTDIVRYPSTPRIVQVGTGARPAGEGLLASL
jgi:hypothetical protein